MNITQDLLHSNITLDANIEFTSNCNLRCTYCAVSQPGYKGFTLQEDLVPPIISKLIDRGVETVALNGHGETTMLKNWVEMCQPLVDKIDNIQIISNFSKLFKENELSILAKFSRIYISIDTRDPKLLAETRRKVDLGIIVQNIYNIRAKAIELEIESPKFIFSAGVYDRNVLKLPEFAYWVTALKIDAIQFWNYLKHPDIEKGINVYPISSLSVEDKQKALQAIDECIAILEKNQVFYVIAGDFVEIFRKDVEQLNRDAEANNQESALPLAEPTAKPVAEQPEPNTEVVDTDSSEDSNVSKPGIIEKCSQGMTRNCFDPWFYTQIKATGEVLPCCVHSPIGHCSESSDLDLVLNNDNITQLRNRLLHGDLDSECSMCVNKPLISVEEFKQKLIEQLDTNNQKSAELEKLGGQDKGIVENTVLAKSTNQSSQSNSSRTAFIALKKAFLFTKQLVPQKIKTALNTQNLIYRYFDENLPADFKDAKYLELNPDVAKAGINARVHYLSCGIEEKRPYK